ncbi:MAG: hypothetical protein ACRCSG_06165 [Cellulosilyticaceae bacterium]
MSCNCKKPTNNSYECGCNCGCNCGSSCSKCEPNKHVNIYNCAGYGYLNKCNCACPPSPRRPEPRGYECECCCNCCCCECCCPPTPPTPPFPPSPCAFYEKSVALCMINNIATGVFAELDDMQKRYNSTCVNNAFIDADEKTIAHCKKAVKKVAKDVASDLTTEIGYAVNNIINAYKELYGSQVQPRAGVEARGKVELRSTEEHFPTTLPIFPHLEGHRPHPGHCCCPCDHSHSHKHHCVDTGVNSTTWGRCQ